MKNKWQKKNITPLLCRKRKAVAVVKNTIKFTFA